MSPETYSPREKTKEKLQEQVDLAKKTGIDVPSIPPDEPLYRNESLLKQAFPEEYHQYVSLLRQEKNPYNIEIEKAEKIKIEQSLEQLPHSDNPLTYTPIPEDPNTTSFVFSTSEAKVLMPEEEKSTKSPDIYARHLRRTLQNEVSRDHEAMNQQEFAHLNNLSSGFAKRLWKQVESMNHDRLDVLFPFQRSSGGQYVRHATVEAQKLILDLLHREQKEFYAIPLTSLTTRLGRLAKNMSTSTLDSLQQEHPEFFISKQLPNNSIVDALTQDGFDYLREYLRKQQQV